jgi:exopolysaccharide biosynthesis polyprenyl glycosylphosphotransferase
MTPNRHRGPIALLKSLDIVFVIVSFGLTTALIVRAQHQTTLRDFLSMRAKISDVLIFAVTLLIYHAIFSAAGLYRSRRLSSRATEVIDLVKATTLATACFVGISAAFTIRMATLPFLCIFWVTTTAIVVLSRIVMRNLLAWLRVRGRNLRYILVFGTNTRAVAFARRLIETPELGYRLVGFVDDTWSGIHEFERSGFTIICDYAGLGDFLRSHVVDEAVIYLPLGSFYHRWSEIANLCANHGIMIRLNADTFGLRHASWRSEEFDGSQYIATKTGAGEGWPLAVKRALDIFVSALLLLFLLPFLATVAIAIKLTSPGPVFFFQERIGVNKRRFRIVKFRTMVPNAEKLMPGLEEKNEVSGPVFKIRNDPRITRIGKFLRRSSIDELPQLLNVLKGEMSLVGPRPLPVRDYEGFNEDWQRRRFSVKPGITCLWQVNGRNGISFDQWMLLDLQYLDEWSLWLDLKILARTVPAVMRGSGAA